MSGLPADSPDCRSCGLCCIASSEQDAWADVDPEDIRRLDQRWVSKNVLFSRPIDFLSALFDGSHAAFGAIRTRTRKVKRGPLKGYSICGCVALRGSPLEQVSCTIYTRRPGVCKDAISAGDRECLSLRELVLRDKTEAEEER